MVSKLKSKYKVSVCLMHNPLELDGEIRSAFVDMELEHGYINMFNEHMHGYKLVFEPKTPVEAITLERLFAAGGGEHYNESEFDAFKIECGQEHNERVSSYSGIQDGKLVYVVFVYCLVEDRPDMNSFMSRFREYMEKPHLH